MKNIISNRALWALLCFATLAGCAAQVPGPSVPFRAGANLDAARGAFDACTGAAERSGQNTLAGHYVGSVLWGGVIVGPIVVASNAPNLRYTGEVSGMDRCLEQRGFVRRDLTPQEIRALEAADRATRRAMLDHLVGGGTLESFGRG